MRVLLRVSNNAGQASGLSRDQKRQTGSLSCMLAGLTAVLSLTACSPQQKPPEPPQDKPLASFQTNLLQTAFDIAFAIPEKPHLDSRSKAQKQVFDKAVMLQQLATARQFADEIGDWRRGIAYADLAYYFAETGDLAAARRHLEEAENMALSIQDWTRDRIFSRLAQTAALLEDSGTLQRFTRGIALEEAAKATETEAMICPEEEYEARKATLLELLQHERYDHRKQGILSSTALFARFYQEQEKREEIAAMIREYWSGFDSSVKVLALFSMCEPAFTHRDHAYARTLLGEGSEILRSAPLHPRQQIPLLAQLAGLMFRSGDLDCAMEQILSAETMYQDRIEWIVNIYRPETLVVVAETYKTMDHPESALKVYRRAVEACVENPNSRPRAENLSLVCASMAASGVEPDEALWNRIKELQANLGDPW